MRGISVDRLCIILNNLEWAVNLVVGVMGAIYGVFIIGGMLTSFLHQVIWVTISELVLIILCVIVVEPLREMENLARIQIRRIFW